MKKRLIAVALGLVLCLGMAPAGAAEGTGFSDVNESDWFAPYVRVCVEHGLMNGVGDGQFAPQRTLSDEESTVLALRLHNIMQGGNGSFAPAEDWQYAVLTTADGTILRAKCTLEGEGYSDGRRWSWKAFSRSDSGKIAWELTTEGDKTWGQSLDFQNATMKLAGKSYSGATHLWGQDLLYFLPEMDVAEEFNTALIQLRYSGPFQGWYWDAGQYAVSQGLWGLLTRYSSATRGIFAQKISAVADLPAINEVDRLPDADEEYILKLYRAGILTGVNSQGTFHRSGSLTRAEAAAMLGRVLEPSLRLTFTLARPEGGKAQGYALTEIPLPDGWTPTGDSNNVAAGWAAIERREEGPAVEEAIYRADGKILTLDGYFVYGFEHLTSRGSAVRLPVLTYGGAPKDEIGPHDGALWNFYDVEEERFLLDTAVPEGDPAWTAAWETYQASPPTWPQVKTEESSGLCGYVDRAGSWVIPAQYDMASPFADGAAVVYLRDGDITATAIDETGRELLPRRYSELWYLGNGVFSYWGDLSYGADDEWRSDCGVVTIEGTETPTPTFSGYFNGGLAAHHGLIAMPGDGSWAYYDYAGNQVTQDFDWAGPIGEDGAGFVSKDGGLFRIQFER